MNIKEFYAWAKKAKVENAEIIYEYYDHDNNVIRCENFEPWLIPDTTIEKELPDISDKIKQGIIKKSRWYIRIKKD